MTGGKTEGGAYFEFMSSSDNKSSALEGLTVLDFSHVFQGPVGTQLLGDFGANVIKVERPEGGDWSRSWGPYVKGVSLPFANLNRNKRSLAIDLKSPKGREVVLKLAAKADIVVHNFRKGVMEKLGFGYEDLKKLNPRLIYAWSSGWGDKGIYADRGRPGHDLMARAEGAWFVDKGDGKPPIPGGISVDYAAGLNLMVAVLVALRDLQKSNRGQFVSTDLLSVAFHAHAWEGATELNADRVDAPAQIGGAEAAIDKAFSTTDGFIEISPVFSKNPLRDISTAMGLGDLSLQERFADEGKQIANRKELNAILAAEFRKQTTAAWIAQLEPRGVLCARVNRFSDVVADPQIKANDMVVEMVHGSAGPLRLLGTPIRLHSTPAKLSRPAPELGEHTVEILRELGYKEEDVAQFEAEGLLGRRAVPAAS